MEVYLYCLLVYFPFMQASWCYFVSNTTATWTEQNSECKMATPVIQNEKLQLNVSINQPLPDVGVWVGYYEKKTAFDYIGCIKTKNIDPTATAIRVGVSTPGRCYSACAYTDIIGIKNSECYCLETKPDGKITEQDCTILCDDMSKTVCGGNDHISLYMKSSNDTDLIQSRADGDCLRIDVYDDTDYTWFDCQRKLYASCVSESATSVTIERKPRSWNDAARFCFQEELFPTRFADIKDVIDDEFYSWTGVLRSGVIYKEIDMDDKPQDIMYGYLTRSESLGYVLNFSTSDVKIKKYILCENAIATPGPHTKMTVQSTTQVQRPTTNHSKIIHTRSNTQGSDVSVIVGVSVSGVLLTATVVLISILIRRKKIQSICKRKPTTREPGQKDSNNTTVNLTSHNNRSYKHEFNDDTDGCDNSSYAHTNHVLEQHVKDSNIDETTHDISGAEKKNYRNGERQYL